ECWNSYYEYLASQRRNLEAYIERYKPSMDKNLGSCFIECELDLDACIARTHALRCDDFPWPDWDMLRASPSSPTRATQDACVRTRDACASRCTPEPRNYMYYAEHPSPQLCMRHEASTWRFYGNGTADDDDD